MSRLEWVFKQTGDKAEKIIDNTHFYSQLHKQSLFNYDDSLFLWKKRHTLRDASRSLNLVLVCSMNYIGVELTPPDPPTAELSEKAPKLKSNCGCTQAKLCVSIHASKAAALLTVKKGNKQLLTRQRAVSCSACMSINLNVLCLIQNRKQKRESYKLFFFLKVELKTWKRDSDDPVVQLALCVSVWAECVCWLSNSTSCPRC